MIRLQIISAAGNPSSLTCQEIVSVDGVPFGKYVLNGELDPQTLANRVVILESAVSMLLNEWEAFKDSLVPVEQQPHSTEGNDNDGSGDTGVHGLRNDSGT